MNHMSLLQETGFRVRKASRADAGQIAQLFYDTIRHVKCRDYSAAQIEAWALGVMSASSCAELQLTRRTFVAVMNTKVVALAELEDDGHIDCFHCHKDHLGCGVGSALMARLQKESVWRGVPRLFAEVTITERLFFEAAGFRVSRQQQQEIRGEVLTNFAVQRQVPGTGYLLAGREFHKGVL